MLEEQELIKQQNSSVTEKSRDTLNQLKPLLLKVIESLQPIAVELDIPFNGQVGDVEMTESPIEPVSSMDTQ